jgi:hypothetical protein
VAGSSLTCKTTNGNILETSCSGSDKAVILSVSLTSEIVGPHTSVDAIMEILVILVCSLTVVVSQEPVRVMKDCECFMVINIVPAHNLHMHYVAYNNCFFSLWAPYFVTNLCHLCICIPDFLSVLNWHKIL